MSDDRKKPGWKFWATVGLVVLLLYVASFGPACWLTSQTNVLLMPEPIPSAMMIYWPLGKAAKSDSTVGHALLWWIKTGLRGDECAVVPTNIRGNKMLFVYAR